jgi:hypothetical protein
MKTTLFFSADQSKYYKKVALNLSLIVIFIMVITQCLYGQNNSIQDSTKVNNSIQDSTKVNKLENSKSERQLDGRNQYIGTSVFVLSSLIPNINAFYYEIDYGRRINDKSELLIAALVQKSSAPMSIGFSGNTNKYPRHVVSGGFAFGYQRYLWKNVFVMPMINPLIVNYYDKDNKRITSGFMLMLVGRLGYRFDFNFFRQPFYFEGGGEICYWPLNTNEPDDFKEIENMFNKFVFSPSLNIGFKFD